MKRLLISLIVALVAAAGCSGDGDTADGGTDLESSVRDFVDAFDQGDSDRAVAYLTDRCQNQAELIEGFMPVMAAADLTIEDYEEEVDGDTATVTYRFDGDAAEFDQEDEGWVLEGGEWRNDQC